MSKIYFLGPNEMFEPIFVSQYSDNTPMVKTVGWTRIVERATKMVIRHNSLNDFVTAMFLVDAVNAAKPTGKKIDTLILPYVPGARQDRSNPTGDVLFAARSVGNMINERNFDRVIMLDPHSIITPKQINNASAYPLNLVYDRLSGYDAVIAPDKGAKMRAETAAAVLGVDTLFASKERDVSSGKILGFQVPALKAGGHYLIVDDICDGGGTFIGLGQKIKEQGATADLYVTHGIFAKGTGILSNFYNNIYTTDSLPQIERPNVTVLPVVKEMENY